jgi:hypothetical protein
LLRWEILELEQGRWIFKIGFLRGFDLTGHGEVVAGQDVVTVEK